MKDYDLRISLSEDKLSALIDYTNMLDAIVTRSDVIEALHEAGVTYGIINSAIDEMINGPDIQYLVTVAVGRPPRHGQDAFIENHYDTSAMAPQIMSDGTVDYKNLGFIKTVNKGDLLVSKTPATPGHDGMTITGQKIDPKPGKKIVLKVGENCELSACGNRIYATSEGMVKKKNGVLFICRLLVIKGNVGIETGNIQFCGQIHVKGNLEKGYTIKSKDDVIIDGIVEGGSIYSKGNVCISKGIHGMNDTHITCKGDFQSKYVNNAYILVYGNLFADSISNSEILCNGTIRMQGNIKCILGGKIMANHINAEIIGSKLGVSTFIGLGIDIDLYLEKEQLKLEKFIFQKILSKFNCCSNNDVDIDLDKKCSDMKSRIKLTLTHIEKIQEKLQKLNGFLKVREIHPDTHIRIGDSKLAINSKLQNKLFLEKDCSIKMHDLHPID